MTQRERDRLVALNKADNEADHPKAGRPANRPQRTASEVAAGEAPQPRRPGRNPCGARPRLQPQDQRQGGKASRRDSLQTALRRLWADPGGGVSAAAPRHPRRPRNAAGLDGRGRAVETPPAQAGTSAPVASAAALPRRAGAMGHLRARLAGRTRREAVPDRHDRRCQQRVAGALRAARFQRREPPFAEDVSGEKRPGPRPSTPTAPACLSTRPKTARARTPRPCLPLKSGGRSRSWASNRSGPIRRKPKDASSAALARPRTGW